MGFSAEKSLSPSCVYGSEMFIFLEVCDLFPIVDQATVKATGEHLDDKY